MKRSWTTIVLFAGLFCLLVVLGVLQYRWQTQITENESERMHKRTQDEADRFSADFNREIQGAYFNFQTDASAWEDRNWAEFNDRYSYWKSQSKYPSLIKAFYYFDANGTRLPMRYNAETRVFEAVTWDESLKNIADRFADPKNVSPVSADIFTLLLPMHEAREPVEKILVRRPKDGSTPLAVIPKTAGYLAIALDEKTISEAVLPDLATSHFGEGDFDISISDKNGRQIFSTGDAAAGNDAAAGLFDVSPGDFIFYANKTLSRCGPGDPGPVISSHIESRTFSRVESTQDPGRTVQIELQSDDRPKTTVFTSRSSSDKAPWTLAVRHRYGSIDSYLANRKFRDLAVGFGILFLVGAAMSAIIYSTQRAKRLAKRQIAFVSSVSHEFRTPLAVIYSAGENLADGVAKDTEQVSRYGELIKNEGRKLTTMVEQILDYAGARSGRRKFNFTQGRISDIVSDALQECQPLIDEKSIIVETALPDTLPVVDVDRMALSQALQNLILNSIKYSNGDPWMRISAENGGSTVRLTVEDRGIGISKNDLRQIFEPFYRAKEVVDAQIHGNGLGLSLVKQIAEAHGGRVTAVSEAGKGSRFTIEIPA